MKYSILLVVLLFITGCNFNIHNIDNTPKKKVEAYLYRYQTLSDDIVDDLNLSVEKEIELDNKYKEKYIEVIKNNFRNMTYEIKSEVINGDNSTVEVEIVVNNLKKAQNKCDNNFDNEDLKCIIENMEKVKEKIKYTILFNVIKDINGNWYVEDLSDEDEDKILGVYVN